MLWRSLGTSSRGGWSGAQGLAGRLAVPAPVGGGELARAGPAPHAGDGGHSHAVARLGVAQVPAGAFDTSITSCRVPPDSWGLITSINCVMLVNSAEPDNTISGPRSPALTDVSSTPASFQFTFRPCIEDP